MIQDVSSLMEFLRGAHTVTVSKVHMGNMLLVAYYGRGPEYPHEAEREEWVSVDAVLNAIEEGLLDIETVLRWFTDPYTELWFETWAWVRNVGEIEALDVETEASFNPDGYWQAKSITVTFSTEPRYVVLDTSGKVTAYVGREAGIVITDSLLYDAVAEAFDNYPLRTL